MVCFADWYIQLILRIVAEISLILALLPHLIDADLESEVVVEYICDCSPLSILFLNDVYFVSQNVRRDRDPHLLGTVIFQIWNSKNEFRLCRENNARYDGYMSLLRSHPTHVQVCTSTNALNVSHVVST